MTVGLFQVHVIWVRSLNRETSQAIPKVREIDQSTQLTAIRDGGSPYENTGT